MQRYGMRERERERRRRGRANLLPGRLAAGSSGHEISAKNVGEALVD
jgi:hypothetical protein